MKAIFPLLLFLCFMMAACAPSAATAPATPPATATRPQPTATEAPAATLAPTAAATQTPSPTATPSGDYARIVTPTIDTTVTAIVKTLVSTVQPSVVESFPSPDGQWRAEVLNYDCTLVDPAGWAENALDELRLARLADGATFTAADQLQYCGGVGAYGLGGITWSPNSRYFYYTDAAHSVPDGTGGFGWQRKIYRFDSANTQSEPVGSGPISPDGLRIAVVQHAPSGGCKPEALAVMELDGQVLARYPLEADTEICHMFYLAWAPDSKAIAYLETTCGADGCASSLFHVVPGGGPRRTLITGQQPSFVEVAWPEPDRLVLSDENFATWHYNFSTREFVEGE